MLRLYVDSAAGVFGHLATANSILLLFIFNFALKSPVDSFKISSTGNRL